MVRRFRPLVLALLAACATAQTDDGTKLYEAGEYSRALESYSRAIERNPHDAEAFYRRGCCLMHLMNREGVKDTLAESAIADLDRAVELAPDEYRVYYARAMTYAAMSRFKEAAQDLLICIQSQDKALKRKAHRRLAQIYDEKFEDMQAQALKHYETYLQSGGNDSKAALRHADLKKAELERTGEADFERVQLKLLESATQASLAGKHAEALELVARILSSPQLGSDALQQAKDLYVRERLAVESDRMADALFETAMGLIKDGKLEAGKVLLEELVKKYPATDAARSKAPAALVELLKNTK